MSKIQSKINKFFDNLKFDKYRVLRTQIIRRLQKYESTKFDYGSGYFYQSLERIGLSGLRNSEQRINTINLNKFLKDKSVLYIGSNIGALSLQLSQKFKSYDNIEYNKTLSDIGEITAKFLNFNKINFYNEDFITKKIEKKYDVIMSMASHSTYDKGIKNTDLYFQKILKILNNSGILIIESHHPEYESRKKFKNLINKLQKNLLLFKKVNTNLRINMIMEGLFLF